jgi:DNA polymerase-3 subunit gamma/tau
VLARKWRPNTFSELIGQRHISDTLLQALRNDRLPHALLFTGPRGTGKTSTARMLAKAIRCPNKKDFVPCNVCHSCVEISQSRSVDVLEIDGASNNGVDSIRELRESVHYMPATGQHKILIIDEVHMLSTSAFNALLKTLEEPPSHVVFILATTEVHKLPLTILSRCQRFDFKQISTRQIAEHLKKICESEKFAFQEDALWLIAREGRGSMRDALSLLDQMVNFGGGQIDRERVVEALGLSSQRFINQVLEALVQKDRAQILNLIKEFQHHHLQHDLFVENLLEHIRHLQILKLAPELASIPNQELIDLPESEVFFLEQLAQKTSLEELYLIFDFLLKGLSDLKTSFEPQIVFEVLLLKLIQRPNLTDLAALINKLEQVQAGATATRTLHQPTDGASPERPFTSRVMPPPPLMPPGIASYGSVPQAKSTPARARVNPSRGPANPSQSPVQPNQAQSISPSMSPLEQWVQFVKSIRSIKPKTAASLESLNFKDLQTHSDKTEIRLELPPKLAFMRESLEKEQFLNEISQLWRDQFLKSQPPHQVKIHIEMANGLGSRLIPPSKAQAKDPIKDSTPAQEVSAKKVIAEEEARAKAELMAKIEAHPQVQLAKTIFKGKITVIEPSSLNKEQK